MFAIFVCKWTTPNHFSCFVYGRDGDGGVGGVEGGEGVVEVGGGLVSGGGGVGGLGGIGLGGGGLGKGMALEGGEIGAC